jgi:hypothetical protein
MKFLLAMREEMRAGEEEADTNQAKADARHEQMMADWRAWREEMIDKRMNASHNETTACQEMEARQEERKPTSRDRKPEAAQKKRFPK